MKITEVKDKKTAKAFRDAARIIYKGDANWICPLDNDIEAVFDPAKNNFHKHGKCTRWILTDDNGKLIGRSPLSSMIKRRMLMNSLQVAWVFSNR